MALFSSPSFAQRCLFIYPKLQTLKIFRRELSSTFRIKETNNAEVHEFTHPQEFVKMQFEPGEWDPEKKDPLYKPPFKSRAKIMSAEDFANRPRVGFEEEFNSYHDAMVTLTWMNGEDNDKIYQTYLEFMSKSGKKTSHEYIMRVLAQRFNIDVHRVAAIVQMGHNEEQYRKEGKEIHHDLQKFVDREIGLEIKTAYSEFDEVQPTEFVEDPTGVDGLGDYNQRCAGYTRVDDLVDVDDCVDKAIIRDKKNARLIIDSHIYIEDIDETKIDVELSKETKKLMKAQSIFQNAEEAERQSDFSPMSGDGKEKRNRWKYVAVMENTRKKKRISRVKKERQIMNNIIVEQNGDLRAATVAEVRSTSHKPKRIPRDFIVSNVKAAWLRRTLQGESDAWGRQEAPPEAPPEAENQEDTEEKKNGDSTEEGSAEIDNPTNSDE